MLWLVEDDCADAESASPWGLQSGLDLYLRLRGLQSGAHAKLGRRSSGGVSRAEVCPEEHRVRLRSPKQHRKRAQSGINNDQKQKENLALSIFQ